MRIGLFGGTFNPIHCCHLTVAEQTLERLSLDYIIFIPSGDPPHKSSESLAPAGHRLEMVRLATAANQNFSVSDIETRTTKTSYTFDTLQTIRQEQTSNTTFFFLVGLDAFLDVPNWKNASQVLGMCDFVVFSRPGTPFAALSSSTFFPSISDQQLKALDSQQQDHLTVRLSNNTTLTLLPLPPCEISASAIRDRLKQGLPVVNWLPVSVESYIIKHQLYPSPER